MRLVRREYFEVDTLLGKMFCCVLSVQINEKNYQMSTPEFKTRRELDDFVDMFSAMIMDSKELETNKKGD